MGKQKRNFSPYTRIIMKNRSLLFLSAFLFISAILVLPVPAQLGELDINPLQLEAGIRPLGMGGAFAGLADVSSAIYNPGGLAWAKGISLSYKGQSDIYAVQAYPTGYNSSLGLTVANRIISDIPITGGLASSTSNVVTLSYGTKLFFLPNIYQEPFFRHLGVGLSLKGLVGQTLKRTGESDRSGYGWDVDLGMLWQGEEWWAAGLSLQNVLPANTFGGGVIKWDGGGEEGVPLVAKVAGSAQIIGDVRSPVFMEGKELLLAGEVDLSPSKPLTLRLGGEWNLERRFYFRSGVMQQQFQGGVTSDLTFGIGLRHKEWEIGFASYKDAIKDQRTSTLSLLYFPKEWIVVKKLDMEKPAVMVEKPIEAISLEDNIVTYDENINVFGKVKPGVEIYVNGLRGAVAADHTFSVVVPLRLKKNLIVVEARYEGEKKSWKYKVLRKAKIQVAEEKKVEEAIKTAQTKEEKEKLEEKKKEIEQKKEKVESLVTMGVIEVTPEAEFVMEAGVTRGELSTWIVRAADLRLPAVTTDLFVDVPKDHPLSPYIKVITDLKLLQPFPDGTFRPGAFVSKEEGDAIFRRFGVIR